MIFGTHDENTLVQYNDVASRAVKTALMADGHLGYVMPIGGVAAYDNQVSVVGVGFDIACGNAAIKTNLTLDRLAGLTIEEVAANPVRARTKPALTHLANEVANVVSFGVGRKNTADDAPVDHALFQDGAWWLVPNIGPNRGLREELLAKARRQLGTVGSGNHYVDIFADESGVIWVGVHFGSRGFGHTIASAFLALSQGQGWGDKVPEREVLLDLGSQLGKDYWELMSLAGRYAYAGREWVARKVVQLLGAEEVQLVHNHHNFAWKEHHDGRELVVVRKGATPAFPGQLGFVGGSMGDDSVILRGTIATAHPYNLSVDKVREIDQLQRGALFSTVHGAGRVMSRTAAAGKFRKGKLLKRGLIEPAMMNDWLAARGVIVKGGGLDEAPQAYRRLPDVLKDQGATIEVVHTLRPLIVVMADARERDPYKD